VLCKSNSKFSLLYQVLFAKMGWQGRIGFTWQIRLQDFSRNHDWKTPLEKGQCRWDNNVVIDVSLYYGLII
jgi:hypothetical protein